MMDEWTNGRMDEWALAARTPAVLVTVAILEGSGPREPGARMLVTQCEVTGTVGGGHLALRAIEIGRAMLAAGRARHVERFALGPGLGQCGGGVMHLAFELLETAQARLLAARRSNDTWRLAALDGAPDSALFDGAGVRLDAAPAHVPGFPRTRGAHVMQEPGGRRWLVAPVAVPCAHLLLFGAGHVGTAVVCATAHLPCSVAWVDGRDDMFPHAVPANVSIEATDAPENRVASAPPGASYLVMTHSHALDLRLAEAILARPDVGWFGLIGSHTKRQRFEHRLRARGIAPARIAAMACPIGIIGISGKEPAVIAASVCAQLLMVWEAGRRAGAR